MPTNRPIPDYLRIHSDAAPTVAALPAIDGRVAELCQTFERATGCPLRFEPHTGALHDAEAAWATAIVAGADTPEGCLRIDQTAPAGGLAGDFDAAVALAETLAGLLKDKLRAETALWRREAELAAGVPIVPRGDDGARLAELLESLLRSAGGALDCQAAGLYLLDENTSELKLRSCWGLPRARLAAPPRPLADAPADLEALSGHAVVLNSPAAAEVWQPPERCTAGVCVPVASANNILGTLWLLADGPRSFSDLQLNTAEIIAGRLAAELERAMLGAEAARSADARRQLDALEQSRRDQTPSIAPLCDGWDVAGRGPQAAGASGFCDWFPLEDDRLAIVLAHVAGEGPCAGMTAASLRASFRAHGERLVDPARLLEAANRTLWAVSAGDQTAAAACLVIEHGGGQAQFAWAGAPAGWWLGQRAAELFDGGLPLGSDPLALYASRTLGVAPGELLILAGSGEAFAAEPAANGACLDLGRWAQAHPTANARALADLLGRRAAASAWPLAVLRRK